MTAAFPPFTEEHEQLRESVKQYALDKLYPYREEWDKAGDFPKEVFRDLADLGVLGIRFGEEYGGLGLDWWYTVAFIEGLSHCRNAGLMMSVLVDTDMATPIIDEIGTDRERFDTWQQEHADATNARAEAIGAGMASTGVPVSVSIT